MNVSDILRLVKDLNLIGNTGAVGDDEKLTRYLNVAYRKWYDTITKEYPFFVQTTQTVAVANGAGTLSPVPHMILSVYDTGNNYTKLEGTDVLEVEEGKPELDEALPPDSYWLEGFASIKTYPKSTTTLRVRYVPAVATLGTTSLEASIMIPPMYHDLLVYETGLQVAYDERDKLMGS